MSALHSRYEMPFSFRTWFSLIEAESEKKRIYFQALVTHQHWIETLKWNGKREEMTTPHAVYSILIMTNEMKPKNTKINWLRRPQCSTLMRRQQTKAHTKYDNQLRCLCPERQNAIFPQKHFQHHIVHIRQQTPCEWPTKLLLLFLCHQIAANAVNG